MTTAEAKTKHEEIDAYIAKLNLNYSAVFIPQSHSRNADKKEASLNWSVSIGPNYGKDSIQRGITTDYMQGIGHAPKYSQFDNTQGGWKDKYFAAVAEKGTYLKSIPSFSNGKKDWFTAYEFLTENRFGTATKGKLEAPLLRDVLYSLVMDSDVLNYASFEEWAADFGYDADSRKAEKVYKECMTIALKLRSLIGNVALDGLRDMFQDY